MKIEQDGFILAQKDMWDKSPRFTWSGCEMPEYGYMTVMPFKLSFDVPADFCFVAAEMQILAAKKKKLLDEFNASVAVINDRISKLQAIENSVEVEA